MAQTGYTPISIYYSSTTTNVPTAGNLVAGELAINTADGKLFYKDSAGVVQTIAGKGGAGVAGGSNTQVQYNSSGSLAGSANMTFNGTTFTLANDASISGLTVGKGGGSGSANTAVGASVLTALTLNSGVTAVGNLAGNVYNTNSDTGASTFIGYTAGRYVTTGIDNTFIGAAGAATTTGSANTAVGSTALKSNTTASNNTAVGYQAGYSNTTGTGNFYGGYQAGYSNTTSNNNVLIGQSAGSYVTGASNTGVGFGALGSTATASGSFNTALGQQALAANTTASNNTAVGHQAGYYVTGGGNTLLGLGAGSATNNLTTGQNNTLIGQNAGPSASGVNNELVVGSGASFTGKGASTGFINPNGGGVYQGNNSASWSTTSDQRLKKNIVDNTDGLNKISAIQVRNFEYRLPEEVDAELKPTDAIPREGVQLGVIAQELQAILPDCVKTESTGVMSVDASNLTWYLINAVKELNAKITALENK